MPAYSLSDVDPEIYIIIFLIILIAVVPVGIGYLIIRVYKLVFQSADSADENNSTNVSFISAMALGWIICGISLFSLYKSGLVY